MRSFTDQNGREWIATAREEDSPRHHTRWFLVFRPEGRDADELAQPEVRWQTLQTAERTLATMSVFELRKRLDAVERRESATGTKN